jgi:hypothetical protein
MNLDVILAYAVGVLAGLAVIGGLAFVIVWAWCAIRGTLHAHRNQPPHQERVQRDLAPVLPERRP